MSLLPTSVESLKRAEERVLRVAERLVSLPRSGSGDDPEDVVDLSAEVVELLNAKNSYAASGQVTRSLQELDDRILDILG